MLEDWRIERTEGGWGVRRDSVEDVRVVEVRLHRRVRVGVDEGSWMRFRRVESDPRWWTWNLCADNRVIIRGGTVRMDDRLPTPDVLVESAGFGEWMRDGI